MKNICTVVSLLFLIIIGCTSTYTIKDFSSKEKFIEDINYAFVDKESKITLTGNSVIVSKDIKVKGDSLFTNVMIMENREEKIFSSHLSDIKYDNSDARAGKLYLKDGRPLTALNIFINHDTIYFTNVSEIEKGTSIPLERVKSVSYNRRWSGVLMSSLSGIILGGVIGFFAVTDAHGDSQGFMGAYYSSQLGLIIGAIIGYLSGDTVIYKFFP